MDLIKNWNVPGVRLGRNSPSETATAVAST
jgi:hypothetical protein